MSKEDLIELEGVVSNVNRGVYLVEVQQGEGIHVVQAQLGGKLKKFKIRVMQGDRVKLGVSPYDLTRGFITYRMRN